MVRALLTAAAAAAAVAGTLAALTWQTGRDIDRAYLDMSLEDEAACC